MPAYISSVVEFNGMVLYGLDKDDKPHRQSLLIKNKSGRLLSRGQVTVFVNGRGYVERVKLFSNKQKAWDYLVANTISQGIIR